MEAIWNWIVNYFSSFISRYSYFIDWNYYGGLFEKYFSVIGFIMGLILVLLVYFSSPEEERMDGFFKMLMLIAVINSCSVVSNYLDSSFNQGYGYNAIEALTNPADNIISGFILTLFALSCYKEYHGRAYIFGMITYMMIPILNYKVVETLDENLAVYIMLLRIILGGFICFIISHRNYFYTSWIWYFGFHVLIRSLTLFLPGAINLFSGSVIYAVDYSLKGIIGFYSRFYVDGIIFAVILAFAIVFEKSVIKKGKFATT